MSRFVWVKVRLFSNHYVGIRNFIVGVVVKVSSDEQTMRREKSYVNKLNLALVQVRPTAHPAFYMSLRPISSRF